MKFSKSEMIVKIAISTTIKFYGIYWLCFSTLGTNADLSSYFRVVFFHVFASCHELKIFYAIVFFVFVYMVNDFIWKQKTTDMLFHYKNMLSDILPIEFCPRMAYGANKDIFPVVRSSTFPKRELFQRIASFYQRLIRPCFTITLPCNGHFLSQFCGIYHKVIIQKI